MLEWVFHISVLSSQTGWNWAVGPYCRASHRLVGISGSPKTLWLLVPILCLPNLIFPPGWGMLVPATGGWGLESWRDWLHPWSRLAGVAVEKLEYNLQGWMPLSMFFGSV